jgi:hypothetical protein
MQAIYVLPMIPGMTFAECKVGVCLVWHANLGTGRCDPGIERIARETGISERHVKRAIKGLEEKRLVEAGRRKNTSNSYAINWRALEHEFAKFERLANTPGGDISGNREVTATSPKPINKTHEDVHSLRSPSAHYESAPFSDENGVHSVVSVVKGSKSKRVYEDGEFLDDAAFVATTERDIKAGRQFSSRALYARKERLEAIAERLPYNDPLGGQAGRIAYDLDWGIVDPDWRDRA